MPILRISSAINGFRRAGVAHPTGPAVYPAGYFSDRQVKQLVDEPRLAVEFLDEMPADQADQSVDPQGALESESASGALTGHLDGVVDQDDTQQSLDEMEEDEVRQIAKEMKITSWHNMGLDKLIEKIKAEQVQVDPEGEA